MKKIKIVTIVGARPQFVKAGIVSREFLKNDEEVEEVIIHTGQHYDENMSDIFFKELDIPKPKYHLGIGSLNHGAMTGRMLEEIEKVLLVEKPDCVLVYGDTNSTLAGALACKKLHIKLAHVEAGLRSFNMNMPEEINRILTDRISDILFIPSQNAKDNLFTENINDQNAKIINCGDVMYDAAIYYSKKESSYFPDLEGDFSLLTFHRAESTDDPKILKNLIEQINLIQKEMPIIFPVHPRTQKKLDELNIPLDAKCIKPVSYLEMIELLKKCRLVITDSGGLQKEAYFFKKPCLTLRNETEWVELVTAGANQLIDPKSPHIINKFCELRDKKISFDDDFYGNGKAGELIVSHLIKNLRN